MKTGGLTNQMSQEQGGLREVQAVENGMKQQQQLLAMTAVTSGTKELISDGLPCGGPILPSILFAGHSFWQMRDLKKV